VFAYRHRNTRQDNTTQHKRTQQNTTQIEAPLWLERCWIVSIGLDRIGYDTIRYVTIRYVTIHYDTLRYIPRSVPRPSPIAAGKRLFRHCNKHKPIAPFPAGRFAKQKPRHSLHRSLSRLNTAQKGTTRHGTARHDTLLVANQQSAPSTLAIPKPHSPAPSIAIIHSFNSIQFNSIQ